MSPANPNTPAQPFSTETTEAPEAPANQAPMTADEIRSKILEQFTTFAPNIQAYQTYAERVAVLSVEYHNQRLKETFGLPIQEEVLLAVLDARETPKSLDTKLAQVTQVPDTKIKRIVFDRVKSQYFLYI